MISQKTRYMVLERDGNCCKSCGQKPPFVMLEVDHIIPKKKGGGDDMNNLQTLCFNCNRGKGGLEKKESIKNLWKQKENEIIYKCSKYFTNLWNSNMMGNIDNDTYRLLMIYLNEYKGRFIDEIKQNASIAIFRSEYSQEEKEYEEKKLYEEMIGNFYQGGNYCDEVLNDMYLYLCNKEYGDVYDLVEEVFDDSNWSKSRDSEYSSKLNYELTKRLIEYNKTPQYVIKKFTNHKKLLSI